MYDSNWDDKKITKMCDDNLMQNIFHCKHIQIEFTVIFANIYDIYMSAIVRPRSMLTWILVTRLCLCLCLWVWVVPMHANNAGNGIESRNYSDTLQWNCALSAQLHYSTIKFQKS